MSKKPAPADQSVRVLRLRLKDKHAAWLRELAGEVNFVWNYANELSFKVWQRERRFMSGYDIDTYTSGASKAGLRLHSQTVQAVATEFVTRRKQFKKVKLRWRVSNPQRSNYSLGWIPFKAVALRYKAGQVWFGGKALSLWDSYGLADYELGAGNICEDARGRWYLNVTVKVKKVPRSTNTLAEEAIGLDLGLKDFLVASDGQRVEAQQFYRDLEPKLAVAQRAGNKKRTRAIHAKIANRRKDTLHKLSTRLVREHQAIFVGNVNASALAKTNMAKSVLDAGWSTFRTMLKYKCDDAGAWFAELNEAYSTQDCHICGTRAGPKGLQGLSVRRWTCPCCGTEHDRDQNAALNIKKRGLAGLESEFYAGGEAGACDPSASELVSA